jgi:hypothetical protein
LGDFAVTVLVIRTHKRFAVCSPARLRGKGKRGEQGLLIELSLEGGRLSNLPVQAFTLDQQVTLRIDGAEPLEARIRWLSDGIAGLRFPRPLQAHTLDRLVRLCRKGERGVAAA